MAEAPGAPARREPTREPFDSLVPLQTTLEDHLNKQVERSRGFFWNRVRWELIESALPATATGVVDVGAGPGFLGEFLAERRPAIAYGFVEPLEGLEQRLEERFGSDANRRDRDFAGATHVALLDVLEHQGDDRAFLAELAAKMDPGATLLLTVPAMPSLWSRWDVALGHYRRYTKAMLAAAAGPTQLEIVESAYLFPELVPAACGRGGRESRGAAADDAAEFPDLPAPVNAALYRVGHTTAGLRRLWPAGTSLFAALRRAT
jgi:SAM-dependent methyltransferase